MKDKLVDLLSWIESKTYFEHWVALLTFIIMLTADTDTQKDIFFVATLVFIAFTQIRKDMEDKLNKKETK